ncbi:MAG: peptide chain release factor N(5)-glutamine methyltransferase [Deltaproteobacteria bacterium]|nr:MAG: peptide chain release factor N(5)-glutamine methyltransferase [Deltaproteobacteria bacterium]
MSWTVRSLLFWAREWLAKKGTESPRLDAELLLASALGCDRTRLYIDIDKPVAAEELARFKKLMQRRGAREPVAYILGVKEFYGRPFAVESGVFIPRPETEVLVQLALEALPRDEPFRALDLCAGSGAVGLSIAAERLQAQVDLVERSPAAAEIAARNAEKLAPGRARVHQGDLYAALPEKARYLAITANPPYLAHGEGTQLTPDITDYEPREALFGGDDGLEVQRRVIASVSDWLAPGGLFGTEIGPSQAESVVALCKAAGLSAVRVERDLAGLDRHVIARA